MLKVFPVPPRAAHPGRRFFGMNTKDMPFQNGDGGTWMASGVAVAASAISYWALRKMRAF
jgi:Mg2+ and Co2+ transporter CorA